MIKFGYVLLITAGFVAFNSCSNFSKHETASIPVPQQENANSYGTYLAGRIAHYRQDFNSAADYYMKTAQQDSENVPLLNRTYLMLASQGRIAEAAKYAKLARTKGDKNDFIAVIIAADEFKNNNYAETLKTIHGNRSEIYKKLISPFVEAWSYAGLKDYNKAVKALKKIEKEKGMEALYYFHAGMLNDYFDKQDAAAEDYEHIVSDSNLELSVRTLQVICNFYLRSGQKDKALALSGKYTKTIPSVNILQKIHQQVKKADENKTEPLIISPQQGLSEAFFNIASIIKNNSEVLDFSHIFVRLAIYENPHNDLARILLANILEMREMYKDAIAVYDEIPASSEAYYIAQYKKAENLRNMNDYKGSELLLKSLTLDYPDDYQTLLDLGDTLRLQEKYKEALKYYEQALEKHRGITGAMWQVYFARGITYERLGNWKKAEDNLTRALAINPNNFLILNYLGYSWLKQGTHPEEAFSFIVKAYNQAPFNSNIADSLGWAFYRLGMYDKAIAYLEKATEAEPSNAVINEHLGDAYWQGGRKNEARFQWNHALALKDTTGEVDKNVIKQKLAEGMKENDILSFDEDKIKELIAEIHDEATAETH